MGESDYDYDDFLKKKWEKEENSSPVSNVLKRVKSIVTLKRRSLLDMRIALGATLFFTIVSVVESLLNIPHPLEDVRGVFWIITVIFNIFICGLLLMLYFSPSTRLALFCTGAIILVGLFEIMQLVGYYLNNRKDEIGIVVVSILCLLAQSVMAFILYRYWEFIMYNYDGENVSTSSLRDSNESSLEGPLIQNEESSSIPTA